MNILLFFALRFAFCCVISATINQFEWRNLCNLVNGRNPRIPVYHDDGSDINIMVKEMLMVMVHTE